MTQKSLAARAVKAALQSTSFCEKGLLRCNRVHAVHWSRRNVGKSRVGALVAWECCAFPILLVVSFTPWYTLEVRCQLETASSFPHCVQAVPSAFTGHAMCPGVARCPRPAHLNPRKRPRPAHLNQGKSAATGHAVGFGQNFAPRPKSQRAARPPS